MSLIIQYLVTVQNSVYTMVDSHFQTYIMPLQIDEVSFKNMFSHLIFENELIIHIYRLHTKSIFPVIFHLILVEDVFKLKTLQYDVFLKITGKIDLV